LNCELKVFQSEIRNPQSAIVFIFIIQSLSCQRRWKIFTFFKKYCKVL